MIAAQDAEEIVLTATGLPFQCYRALLGLSNKFGNLVRVLKLVHFQFL